MCFSPTASFISSMILTTTWIYSIKKVDNKSILPFASIPVLFGIQQFIEGIVWISFWYPIINTIATYWFVFFAYVFWPVYVPITIYFAEEDILRKKILKFISAIWFIIWIFLLASILANDISSKILGNSIFYDVPVKHYLPSFILYFIATSVSIIMSSHKKIQIFGGLVIISFFIANHFYKDTLFSVWCFFSALLSLVIHWHLNENSETQKINSEKLVS